MKKYAAPVIAAVLAASMTVPAMAGYTVSFNGSSLVTKTETPQTVSPQKTVSTAKVTETASPTSSKIYVNGALTGFDAYNIKGNNYFKLRDVAYALSGTENQFNVIWDAEAGEIKLVSGEAYAKVGGLKKGSGAKKTATLNTAPIMKDSKYVTMTAYTIDGNNYFKLRDLGDQFGFTVGWNALSNAVTMETDGYTPDLTAGVGGNGTVYVEGSNHPIPKAGDTVIKADGTKVVLQATIVNGVSILGVGTGVDIWSGMQVTGSTVKENSTAPDNSPFYKCPTTGEMHSAREWGYLEEATNPNNKYKGDYDGEVLNHYWKWDSDARKPGTNIIGYWKWVGPEISF